MNLKGQKEIVIKHVKEHGEIDALTAIMEYGITRLGGRVHELQDSEHALRAYPHPDLPHPWVIYRPNWDMRKEAVLRHWAITTAPRKPLLNMTMTELENHIRKLTSRSFDLANKLAAMQEEMTHHRNILPTA
ncbi:helix-turn-helix domain-containing protein [Vibrio panuliri]|uniref:Winged helix-turn-helix domain-containing protein n=1 Tax=Vibrio panuliri TaxID=1381081 RepID=A0ABX3FJP2_9VIBR|nr:helix-turn-helix domain-containing protein [Vibrio panuliri]KAB1460879.1 hypothetical protein F7O85_00445 [Vibrio panuliri]OLQ91684.1 hypothetical protein BIY20_09785 [Vibrio panuliri]